MEHPQPHNSTIECLVVRDEPNSSSSVINEVFLNKEDAIGDQISSVNMSQPLILPQKTLQFKIIPASNMFKIFKHTKKS